MDIRTREIERLLPETLARDRFVLERELSLLRPGRPGRGAPGESADLRLQRLERRARRSARARRLRGRSVPDPRYNRSLPIYSKAGEIVQAIRSNQVVIISGETGSGKTTQIPRFCLEAGRGISGVVGCTQPRRIAAVTVAERIAEEMGEEAGRSVGYEIRFQRRMSPKGFIKIMTDGILLAEAHRDPLLAEYDTLIIDEAHERSLNIDFLLGVVKRLLGRRRDLKLIVTSATIDTEKFSRAFGDAPVVEVSGRLFAVEVRYLGEETEEDYGQAVGFVERAVRALEKEVEDPLADVLIFMPTEESILETCQIIEARRFEGTTVLPLFARLSAADQRRVFAPVHGRKIVVATNVAETSLTIPGIRYVIDTGLARIPRYSPRSRITSLPVVAISRSSADQRMGRSGRVENGVCLRLYSEADYSARPLFTPPEILRTNLAEVILRMLFLGLGDPAHFPFVDPPAAKSVADGFQVLLELGALEERPGAKGRRARRFTADRWRLTERGVRMASLPLDPTLSRMLIQAQAEDCVEEMLTMVSALSIQDPRVRPADRADLADQRHAAFGDPLSDFVALLNLWRRYQAETDHGRKLSLVGRFCRENFLSFKRMREWEDVRHQLAAELAEEPWAGRPSAGHGDPGAVRYPEKYAAIHRCILSGFLANIAEKKEKNLYRGARGRELMVFPGSTLWGRAGQWIVAAETVETTRLYARTVANVEAAWIEEVGRHLCRYSYSEPRWDRERNAVMALEKVTLFGLTIRAGRLVPYGPVNPKVSGPLFIRHALVRGETDVRLAFAAHNQRLASELREVENRLRRRGILGGEDRAAAFYERRLAGVADFSALQAQIRSRGGDGFLRMKREDLLEERPAEGELDLYPTSISLGGETFACEYVFEPGAENDGLTLLLPAEVASLVPARSLEWLVPGFYREKIAAVLRGLPKRYRRPLVPLPEKIDLIVREMPRGRDGLYHALSEFVLRRFGVAIPPPVFAEVKLPNHLTMRISLRDAHGNEIGANRDLRALIEAVRTTGAADRLADARKSWERSGITRWDFGDLPESVRIRQKDRRVWEVYPALAAQGETAAIRLFVEKEQARVSHRDGVALLYGLRFAAQAESFAADLPRRPELEKTLTYFGGPQRFWEALWRRTVRELFQADVRTQAEFHALAERMTPELFAAARDMFDRVEPVLTTYRSARDQLHTLRRRTSGAQAGARFLADRERELDRLLPRDFVRLCPRERLPRLPSYLKALMIRCERGYAHAAKDRGKAAALERIGRQWRKRLGHAGSSASLQKKRALRDFAWLLEEYKITLFAPEVGTAERVSEKRLLERLGEIDRML